MTSGVFMHKDGSIYDDIPEVHYQFPKIYLSRAKQMVGEWIVYREPVKIPQSKGFFAVAKVEKIVPDPEISDRYRALITPGSYLPFQPTVPHIVDGEPVERDLANAQAAVRPLSNSDFARIIALGLPDEDFLPRTDGNDDEQDENRVRNQQMPFEVEHPVITSLVCKKFRDRAFRRAVLTAYDERCAFTGLKLINGGGRAEAQAAHIRPVVHNGPDSIRNGLALSGTAHWMFDRGLIGLSDDLSIMISRQVNDLASVEGMLNKSGKATAPERAGDRPHPAFLSWHREHCFKA
ncbi:HNH endonuclease [Qipengyuania sp. CAU 1752]